jgi:hypothetical protein
MFNRFQLNTITPNSLISALIKQVISIFKISHGTKLGGILRDIDDKNQMWNKEVFITSINKPVANPFVKIISPRIKQDTGSKVFGVKITE